MGTLSPEALVQLWTECLDYARKHKLGVFGVELSEECRAKIDREWESAFGEKKVPSAKTGP